MLSAVLVGKVQERGQGIRGCFLWIILNGHAIFSGTELLLSNEIRRVVAEEGRRFEEFLICCVGFFNCSRRLCFDGSLIVPERCFYLELFGVVIAILGCVFRILVDSLEPGLIMSALVMSSRGEDEVITTMILTLPPCRGGSESNTMDTGSNESVSEGEVLDW